jgi:peptidoglycan DL-endopeptidase CwlO
MVGLLCGAALAASPGSAAPGVGGPAKPPSKAALDQQISASSNQLEVVIEQYDSTGVALAATVATATRVNAELAPLQQTAAAAHAKVAVLAADLYQTASPGATLGQIINASSTNALVNRLSMINQIAREQDRAVDALNAAAATYVAQKQQLTVLENTQANDYGLLKAKRASILGQIAQLKSLRLAAYGPTGTPAEPIINYIPVFTADAGGKAVKFAYDQLGKPYRFGASGPSEFDCSGLTMMAWKAAGVNLPHSAAEQYTVTKHITRAELRPGDLVFYFQPIHHVGIYIGADKVINAPTYGEPVKISPLTLAPIAGYGRP